MTQFLEVTQLVDEHGMAQVQVRRRRVKARLHAKRLSLLQFLDQFGLDQQLIRTALDQRQRIFDMLFQNTTPDKSDNRRLLAQQLC